jgi:uncharacterized protein (DUF305 family)
MSRRAYDHSFMRRMTAHHQIGIQLAQLAAEKAEHEELRVLGRLMVAEQQAEIGVLRDWWRSWSGGDVPPPSPEEHATMPGMPPPSALEALAGLSSQAFEARFLDLMIRHHRGAVLMANEAWAQAGDRRLALFAD